MKKAILLFTFVTLSITNFYAQGWEWRNTENASCILKDNNNDLYVISNQAAGFTIAKRSSSGSIQWTKTGTGNAVVSAYKVDQLNNLVLVGNLTSTTTIDGNIMDPNGTQSFFILKMSPASILLSANVYGSTSETYAKDLCITAAGDFLVGGAFKGNFDVNGTWINGDTLLNFFILKTDSNQNLLWSERGQMYTASGESYVKEVVETASGKIYAMIEMEGGLVEYKGYQFDGTGQYILQLNNLRDLNWENYVCYPPIGFESFSDLQTIGDTVYVREFLHAPHVSGSSIYMMDDTGAVTHQSMGAKQFAYKVSDGKIFYALMYTDGLIGSLATDLSPAGGMHVNFPSSDGIYDNMEVLDTNTFYIGGIASGSTYFAGKFNKGLATPVAENELFSFSIFPNPGSGQFTLQLQDPIHIQANDKVCVFDVLGNCVIQQNLANAANQQIDISGMAKGIYFVEVGSAGPKQKIILN